MEVLAAEQDPDPRPDPSEVAALRKRLAELERANALIVDAVGDALAQRLGPLDARLETLEAAAMTYAGIYDTGKAYSKSALVTHGESGWVALDHVPAGVVPGKDPPWRLAVKSGTR